MGSDHRCVMATVMITTPKKDGHRKINKDKQQNTTEGIKLKKTLGMRSLSSKKRYQEIIEKKEKAEAANKELSQSKEKRRNKKTAAQAKSERTEAEAKEADGKFSLWNRGEERCGDGKRSRWRTSWTSHTSERGGRFFRATCRTGHGREREDRHLEWRGLPWRRGHDGAQARRNEWKAEWKRDRCPGEELPEHCTRTDEEAGSKSIVLHVGHDMNEKEKNDRWSGAVCYEDEIMMEFKQEETNAAAAEKDAWIQWGDIKGRRGNQKTYRGEKNTTPKEEKQRLKEVNKQLKTCIRDKQRAERREEIQRILEDFKGIKKIPGIKSAKKKSAHHQDKEWERRSHYVTEGNCQCLWWILKNCTTTKNTKKLNKKTKRVKMKAAPMCKTKTQVRCWEFQRSRLES